MRPGADSKPNRGRALDQWVLLSTMSYANEVVRKRGSKPGTAEHTELLETVAEAMYGAFTTMLEEQYGAPCHHPDTRRHLARYRAEPRHYLNGPRAIEGQRTNGAGQPIA